MLNLITVNTTEPLICKKHNEAYSNYCSAATTECQLPLCPVCMEAHIIFHNNTSKPIQLTSIREMHRRCVQKIMEISERIDKEIEDHGKVKVRKASEVTRQYQQSLVTLREARSNVEAETVRYFKEAEQRLKQVFDDTVKFLRRPNQLEVLRGYYKDYLAKLENADTVINYIGKTLQLVVSKEVEDARSRLNDYKETTAKLDLSVHVDANYKEAVMQTLYKNLRVCEKNMFRKEAYIEPPKDDYGSPTKIMSASRKTDDKTLIFTPRENNNNKNNNNNNTFSKTILDYPELQDNSKQMIEILSNNSTYSGQEQWVPFFQAGDCYLNIYDLKHPGADFRRIRLDINFRLPYDHQCITTTDGSIYLIGGQIPNSKLKSPKIYKYDRGQKTLKFLSNMKYGRSGHSVALCDNYIYILGGVLNDDTITDKVEKYNILRNTIQEVRPCRIGSIFSGFCSNNGKELYKFGGIDARKNIINTIQVFNIDESKWHTLEPESISDTDIEPVFKCQAIKASNNEIMVFGGRNSQGQGTRQTYLFQTDKKMIHDVNTCRLPRAEGFDNIPMIFDRKLYALQNVRNLEEEDYANKKIVSFDGYKWREFN